MDAGADLVVTQLFYDVERFIQYEKDCRSVGIEGPIIPGACPIHMYGCNLKSSVVVDQNRRGGVLQAGDCLSVCLAEQHFGAGYQKPRR